MPVPLRSHLEAIGRAEEKRINVLFSISVLAALFVWIEIERRLRILNHAHEKAVEVQHTYVRDDVYEQDKINRDAKIAVVEKAQLASQTKRTTTIAVITICVSVVAAIALLANGVI